MFVLISLGFAYSGRQDFSFRPCKFHSFMAMVCSLPSSLFRFLYHFSFLLLLLLLLELCNTRPFYSWPKHTFGLLTCTQKLVSRRGTYMETHVGMVGHLPFHQGCGLVGLISASFPEAFGFGESWHFILSLDNVNQFLVSSFAVLRNGMWHTIVWKEVRTNFKDNARKYWFGDLSQIDDVDGNVKFALRPRLWPLCKSFLV